MLNIWIDKRQLGTEKINTVFSDLCSLRSPWGRADFCATDGHAVLQPAMVHANHPKP